MSIKNEPHKQLGKILVDKGIITEEILKKALAKQSELNENGARSISIGKLLLANNHVSESQLKAAVASQKRKSKAEFKVKGELEEIYGELVFTMSPAGSNDRFVEEDHEHDILVAEGRANSQPYILVTKAFQANKPNALLSVRSKVIKAYQESSSDSPKVTTIIATRDVLTLYRQTGVDGDVDGEASKTSLEVEFENLVKRAYEAKAVDLHFFRRSDNCRVRFRVWGSMRDHEDWEPAKADSILSVGFSTFGKGSLYSHWKSNIRQRVRIKIVYSQFITLDCRYEHAPGDDGAYHACIRILANDRRDITKQINLQDLGFTTAQTRKMEAAASRASGMVILAGPTGSGKSTTLAGLVKYINRNDDVNVLTVESPIERELPAFQTAVSDDDGADPKEFAMAIKSTLRRDPDALMVGEIRDEMSASAAATGAQTGHTLLTTVHAQSGIEIVERLSSPALALPPQTIGSPSFISILIFQMLLPVMDEASKIKLTSNNIGEHLSGGVKDRLLMLVPDIDDHEICVRGSRPEFPEGVASMTICAEVVVPDETMRLHFRSLELSEALAHWVEQGRKINEGAALDERVSGLKAESHAVGKMLSGMIDPRDVEQSFGHLDLIRNDFS